MTHYRPRVQIERITTPRCGRSLTISQQLDVLGSLSKPFSLRELAAAITANWPQYYAGSVPRMAEAALSDWLARGAIKRTPQPGIPQYRRV